MDPTPTTRLCESPLDDTRLIDKLTKAGIKIRDFALGNAQFDRSYPQLKMGLEEPQRNHQRKKLRFVRLLDEVLDEVQTTPRFVTDEERMITEGEEGRPLTEVETHRRHKQPTQEGWDTASNILGGHDDAQSD